MGVVAIPTGIISAGFVEQYTKNQHSDMRISDINEVGEVLVDKNSDFRSKTVREVSEKYCIQILVILRNGLTIVPIEDVTIKTNDILIIRTEKLVKS